MEKLKNFVKRRKYLLIVLAVLVLAAVLLFKKGNGVLESYTVVKGDVTEQVLLSGKVETGEKADLGFADSGRISKIYVKNNQIVGSGQMLAQLEIGDLLADLSIKEAGLRTSDVDLEAAEENLQTVTAQEDAKVENAYRKLLSEDLEATPESESYTMTAPVITGVYDGSEGKYKIVVRRKEDARSDFYLHTFELEGIKRLIEEEKPTMLGERGLYISFTDNLEDYDGTIWYAEIPNKSGAAYLDNYNAYIQAKKDRDLKIKTAKAEYDKLLSKEKQTEGALSVAQAEIQKIKAEIRKNTIYAPFSGKVTNIEKEVGESVGTGERIVSILGEENLEVVFQVSELDVSKLSPGASVEIVFDAFKEEKFAGTLKTVNSRETEVDGVPIYEAFVELGANDRVKSGMNAEGIIVLNEKRDVVLLPTNLVEESEESGTKGKVMVLIGEKETEEREVSIGLKGTDGMVEITSGLYEGEKIVSLPAK